MFSTLTRANARAMAWVRARVPLRFRYTARSSARDSLMVRVKSMVC
jgi:hypothetical protein